MEQTVGKIRESMPDIHLEMHLDTWALGNETLWNIRKTALNVYDTSNTDEQYDGFKIFFE